MDERVVQFRVGVMVLASLLIVVILITLFGEMPEFAKRLFQPTYTIRFWFPEARGLRPDSPVRRNGIRVGRVTNVQFAGEEDLQPPEGLDEAEYDSGVVVTAAVHEGTPLYEHDVCRIQTDLLGKPSLHFARPPGKPAQRELLDTAKVHRGEIAPDPLDSIGAVTETLSELTPNVNAASVALANAGKSLDDAAKRVTAVLDEQTQRQLKNAIALADESLRSVRDMVGDEETRKDLKAALKQLPGSLDQLNATMKAAQGRLDEMQALTQQLGSEEMVGRLERGTQDLEEVMENLARFSRNLRDPQGSLGLMLRDRQLYDHLSSAAANIDNLTRQLRPILNDVRIFTDKIARHPERLGARGALQRYPGIK